MLNPAWLFGLFALVIPIAIHLWNIRPGKTLKVGSIMLMDKASRQSSRSFKVTEVLLLITRCLLLALIALFLAAPVWSHFAKNQGVKGWILIPREVFTETYQHFKPEVDSLTRIGYEFHYYNGAFPKANITEILAQQKTARHDTTTKVADYWQQLLLLNQQAPADLPIALFTPNGLKYFSGNKPASSLKLKWAVYTPKDSVDTWLAAGWLSNHGSIRLVQGSSKPSATVYNYYNIKSNDGRNSPFQITVNSGRITAATAGKNEDGIAVDTSTDQIAIVADNKAVDAGYVKAALSSVAEFTQRKSVIKIYQHDAVIPSDQKWIFWLSERTVPAAVLHQCKHILMYHPGKIEQLSSWIVPGDRYGIAQNNKVIALFRRINPPVDNNQVIWHDGYGKAVLSLTKTEQKEVYHFYSRFNPAWSDLVWSEEFPKLLLKLTAGAQYKDTEADHDRRILSATQVRPMTITENHPLYHAVAEQIDLSHYCWLLLLLIFMVERWLAHQTKLTPSHG